MPAAAAATVVVGVRSAPPVAGEPFQGGIQTPGIQTPEEPAPEAPELDGGPGGIVGPGGIDGGPLNIDCTARM